MDKIRILLTGGHAATTGIAVTEEIRKTPGIADAEIYWVGSKIALEGSKIATMESHIFPRIGVNFVPITTGKIQTKFTRHTIPSILKIPVGFIQAVWFLVNIKPKVILSFGGYSSFPVVFWGWVFRIPVVLHEQTTAAGRASILSGFFASKIALSREESLKYFPKNKSVVTGNPLMSNILVVKRKPFPARAPTLFVIGGSRGSNFINELVMGIAKSLLPHFLIVHVTGEQDFSLIEKFKEKLPSNLRENYKTFMQIDPLEIGKYYSQSDLIISRSGANSVSEILYVKRPTILIPLPRTFMNEQVKNAEYAAKFGFTSIFLEKEATPNAIINEITRVFKDWPRIEIKAAKEVSPDINASGKIVEILLRYI